VHKCQRGTILTKSDHSVRYADYLSVLHAASESSVDETLSIHDNNNYHVNSATDKPLQTHCNNNHYYYYYYNTEMIPIITIIITDDNLTGKIIIIVLYHIISQTLNGRTVSNGLTD